MLSLPAKLYARLMSWREAAYFRNWLPRWRPPAPCISVGNICWGGTGKTPFCQWLLRWADRRNLRPVLLTRGYKARPAALPYRVRPDSPVDQAGDEPLLLAQAAPGARIVVDPKRTRSGPWAWNRFHPDLFILDDGFQHLPVIRDLDLVLLLPSDLNQNWGRTIPAGTWREGPVALSRADALLIKAEEQECDRLQPLIQSLLGPFDKPLFSFSPQPRRLFDPRTHQQIPTLDRPYLLVSGVAHPASVEQTATALLSAPPSKHLAFADHHSFSHRDILQILQEADSLNVTDVICTAKDAVKLTPLLDQETALHWWRLDVDIVFGQPRTGGEGFDAWLENWWQNSASQLRRT
jgi:tetraacyldisaccharide 4'-kinase